MKKSEYLLNDLRNFNESFRKDLAYDNIKVTKKQVFTLSLQNIILEAKQRKTY